MIYHASQKNTRMVRILMFPTPNSEYGYYRNWYENSTEIVFEGSGFQGIRDYDSYLNFKFGKYMDFPSPKMRKAHPVSQLKLL